MRETAIFRHAGRVLTHKLINAMTRVEVKTGTDIVTQYDEDEANFYVVDSGICNLLDNSNVLGIYEGA